MEYQSLQTVEHELSARMERLLEVFDGLENPSSDTEALIRSILYPSDSGIANFVNNYGAAIEHLCKTTAANVNLKFIRRRKQFIDVMRLEQARKQETDDLVFHVSDFLSIDRISHLRYI